MKLPCTHGIAAAAVAGRLGQNMMQWPAESVHPGYHLVRYAAVLAQATVQLVDTTSLVPDGQTLPDTPRPVGGARAGWKLGSTGPSRLVSLRSNTSAASAEMSATTGRIAWELWWSESYRNRPQPGIAALISRQIQHHPHTGITTQPPTNGSCLPNRELVLLYNIAPCVLS
jgi:hypothetical protein